MSTRKLVPPDLHFQTYPQAPITPPESVVEDSEMEDDGSGLNEGFTSTRPLTVAIPRGNDFASGPYCPRRPNLAEILSDQSPPPWSLSQFMAYLSQNHCLETLEFTMDAARYKKHYEKMMNRNKGSPEDAECHYVKMLWQKLLGAYIAPNGAREVNLPSNIRDSIMALHDAEIPPHPSQLEPATQKVYELMEESVLMPFLNSMCPQSAYSENSHHHTQSYDERAMWRRQRERERLSNHTSSSSVGGGHTTVSSVSEAMTDESGSGSVGASSPTTSQLSDPMTPPTTPPMSDYGSFACGGSPNQIGVTLSPRTSRGETSGANAWKRMGSKLGLRKSRTVKEDDLDVDMAQ